MSSVLTIVAPVFGLIVIGYLSGRLSLVSEAAAKGIADFAFTLAIPALLCRTVASAELGSLSLFGILGSFYTAGFLTWITAALLTVFVLKRPGADAPAIGMTSTFGNSVMLGIPLSLGVYGTAATPVFALIISIHAPIWWLTGMLHASVAGDYAGQSRAAILKSTLNDLIHNPIVLGILAGAAWRLTGAPLPATVDRLMELMAQASVPTALVALGLSLVNFQIKGQVPTLITVTFLKLLWMPSLAWLLSTFLFQVDDMSRGIITIVAAMPTGANAFLFASKLNRAVDSTSGAVALGSLLTVLTASILVSALHAQ